MGLQIMPNGSKRWRFRYRFDGLPKMISLGLHPAVSLDTARRLTQEAHRLLSSGIDPSSDRKARQRAEKQTFEVIARQWLHTLARAVEQNRLAHGTLKRSVWLLETYLIPSLGARPMNAISANELLVVLKRIELLGLRDTPRRAKQKCSQLYRYAIGLGVVQHDITAELRGLLEPAMTRHHASITDPARLGELLRAIDGYDGNAIVGLALKLAPLVFVRPVELRTAEWAHIDFAKAQWRIPAARMKMKVQHLVPLSRQAIDVLSAARSMSSGNRCVFPAVRDPSHPIHAGALNAALRALGYRQADITAHGFRTTACSLLNELGWRADAIERQLAHSTQGELRRLYNHAEYLPERRLMMQAWADYLDKLRAQ